MEKEEMDQERFGQLKCAIMQGHREMIESLLDENTPVDNPFDIEKDFRPPLHSSVYLGDLEIARKLLDRGASVNVVNENDETALMLAAKFEKYDIVDLLLSDERLKNIGNRETLTHLHIACMRNRIDVVKKLLKHPAEVNIPVKPNAIRWPGYTPLHFAVQFKCIDAVAFLLSIGADVTIKDSKQLTALHLADMYRNEQIIDMILVAHKRVAMNPVNSEGLSHFHIACTRNNKEVVECFIKNGALLEGSVHETSLNWNKFAAIDFATYYNCIDIVELLLQQSNRETLPSRNKIDRVRGAHMSGNKQLANLVLERDRLVKEESQQIKKPPALHFSCIYEDIAVVMDSFSKKPNELNTVMWQGSTPLHLALERGNERIVRYLLDQGADYNIKNADGKSSLHLAFERANMQRIVILILDHLDWIEQNPANNDGLSHFHIACLEGKEEAVAHFINLGVNVNTPVNFDSVFWPGFTPLHFAAKSGSDKVVRMLLKHGASYSAVDKHGQSALDVAISEFQHTEQHGASEILEIMRAILSSHLKYKIDSFNDRGFSLLHFLYSDPSNGTRDMKEFIREHQEDINKAVHILGSPWDGYTPLHFALSEGGSEQIKILLELGADLSSVAANGDYPYHLTFYRYDIPEVPMNTLDFDKLRHNPVGSRGHSLFHMACVAGNLDWIKYFLDNGVDPNVRITSYGHQFCGMTSLHLATRTLGSSNFEVVKLLLENGADASLRDIYLNTPLHGMIGDIETEIIDLLISHGVDVNSRNAFLETPLLTICRDDFWFSDDELSQKIEKLLNHGADIYLGDESDLSPMAVEIWENRNTQYPMSIEILLKHVTKLEAMGCHASEANREAHGRLLQTISAESRSRISRYEIQCRGEIESLKKIRTNVQPSLCDVLSTDLNGLSVMSKNDEFQNAVNSNDFREKYPIYGSMIELRLKEGNERRQLITDAEKNFKYLTNISLPLECLERILQCLSNDDLKNISS